MPVVQRIERRVADPKIESSILSGHTLRRAQGGMPEWINGLASKAMLPERETEVRILFPPPRKKSLRSLMDKASASGAENASSILAGDTE